MIDFESKGPGAMHTQDFFLNSAKQKVLNSLTNGSLSGLYQASVLK